MGLFHIILLVPHNTVMDMNNVMGISFELSRFFLEYVGLTEVFDTVKIS